MGDIMKTILLLAAVLATPVAAHAEAFRNGGFETFDGAPGGTDVRTGLDDGDTRVTGWVNNAGLQFYEDDQDGLAAYDGTHYVSFGHNGATGGTLSQTFDTVAGTAYTVNYFFAEQQGDDPAQRFAVSVNGGAAVYSGTPALNAWTAGPALTFLGTGSPTTLTFQDATPSDAGGGSNLALDGISLTAVGAAPGAVPEPATWAMMMAGFGAMGAALRRRQTGAARKRPA